MTCQLTEMELWSGLDRDSAEIRDHLKECGLCRDRARQFEAGIGAVADAGVPQRLPVPDRIGPYRIIARLGEGGMGIVYEGEQTSPRRSVAIKVMRGGSYDEYRVKLFQREAQTLARLRHPAIGSIYEAGRTEDGRDYFTMELVRGIPLTTYVQTRDIPTRDRLDLFRRICDAITYAHQRGVIHRDIKPSNIMLARQGRVQDVVKVLDFGLVKRVKETEEPEQTGLRTVKGTPHYMSPEAINDPTSVDARSDLYALGAVGYFLLAGRPVFDGNSVFQVCLHHVQTTPTPLREVCPEPIPEGLERLILSCLAKSKDDRPASAEAFADALDKLQLPPWSRADAERWWALHGESVERQRESMAPRITGHTMNVARDRAWSETVG